MRTDRTRWLTSIGVWQWIAGALFTVLLFVMGGWATYATNRLARINAIGVEYGQRIAAVEAASNGIHRRIRMVESRLVRIEDKLDRIIERILPRE